MLIGFFIEPNEKLRKIIVSYKKIIKRNFGNQLYLSHPVHLTLFTVSIKRKLPKDKIIEIDNFVKNFKKIKIKTTNIKFFYNDPQTKGHTMFLALKKNASLNNFQMQLIKFVNKIAGRNIVIRKNKFKGKLRKDHRRYGYPFVGKNWIPHFTVSSIDKKHNLKTIKTVIKNKVPLTSIIKKISIWNIKKNYHKKIYSIKLK